MEFSSLDHIADLVTAGADKISINSSALKNPDLITEGAKRFGSQCIVLRLMLKKLEITGRSSVMVALVPREEML